MVYIHIRQQVEDYAKWREGFNSRVDVRKEAGATDEVYIMCNVDNPNDVTLILGWSDPEKAKAYTESTSLKAAREKGGVTGPSEVRILETAA